MSERVFIGNISYNVDEKGLTAAFAEQGFIAENVKIVMDRETGSPRGFGFADVESAREAIAAMNGYKIDGRPIAVAVATEKPRAAGGRR